VAGVLAQAACFAIFHLLPERMPQTFALGLVTGVMTLATRSLLPAIACHAAHNSIPLAMLWLAGGLSGPLDTTSVATAATTGMSLSAGTVLAALASMAVGTVMIWLTVRGRATRGPLDRRAAGMSAVVLSIVVAVGGGPASAADPVAPAPAAVPERLRVGVVPISSAVEWKGDQPSGVMIDVWNDLARRLGLESDFIRIDTFKHLMDMVTSGEVDVALGPVAITEERERAFDLTHPVFHSGLRVAVRQRNAPGFIPVIASFLSWDLLRLFGVVLAMVIASGHLLWWFERGGNPESFPPQYPRGVWEAIWWIASTIVAGGCDNKHVATALGRAIAFTWMVGGIVLLAAFTSVLTATLTAEQVTGKVHGPRDLTGRTVGCVETAVTVQVIRQRGGVPREFPTMSGALDALSTGFVDAVVGENQQLMYLTNQPDRRDVKLVGPIFESFDYGLGLPNGSPLREPLNMAILRMREDGTFSRIREQWLGIHD